MLKHIVMGKLKEQEKEQNCKKIKTALEGLKGKIPEIVDIEVGISAALEKSDQSYDLVLYSIFKDEAGLKEYQKHPLHIEIAEFIGKVREKRVVLDYFI